MTKSNDMSDPTGMESKTGPDALLQSSPEGATELSEADLQKAAGGRYVTQVKVPPRVEVET